jgi:hypothetical protein
MDKRDCCINCEYRSLNKCEHPDLYDDVYGYPLVDVSKGWDDRYTDGFGCKRHSNHKGD